jgi:hypothetical protein
MEYRKKHMKPKRGLAPDIQATLSNNKLMETIDFF